MTPELNGTMLFDAMNKLSDMGNSVAGFAIGADLALIFASLKDLSHWVTSQPKMFITGIVVGHMAYACSIWWLHHEELSTLLVLNPPSLTVLQAVSLELAEARIAGLVFFATISMLAMWGTAREKG